MRQGTTPKHTFRLPFSVPEGSVVRIIYKQDNSVVFVKTAKDCAIEGDSVSVRLTQEETFQLDEKYKVRIQLRILTPNQEALESEVIVRTIEECLEREVMCLEETGV